MTYKFHFIDVYTVEEVHEQKIYSTEAHINDIR